MGLRVLFFGGGLSDGFCHDEKVIADTFYDIKAKHI
jgi:hypothetical protein